MRFIGRQEGAALLITVIIVLVMSVIAVTATNTNQLQQLLVRGSQLQLLVHNHALDEIRSQLIAIRQLIDQQITDGHLTSEQPADLGYLGDLVKKGPGAALQTTTLAAGEDEFGLRSAVYDADISRSVMLTLRRAINISIDEQAGLSELAGSTNDVSNEPPEFTATCYEFELQVDVQMSDFDVRSQQFQIVEILQPSAPENAMQAMTAHEKVTCETNQPCGCFSLEGADSSRVFIKSWWELLPKD